MFNQAIDHRFYDVIRPCGIFGEHEKKLAITNRCVLNSQIQHRFGKQIDQSDEASSVQLCYQRRYSVNP